MINRKKIIELSKKLMIFLKEELGKESVTREEVLHIVTNLLTPVLDSIVDDCHIKKDLDRQEEAISSIVIKAIHCKFDLRRTQLRSQGAYTIEPYSCSRIVTQITDIFSERNVTPSDGLVIFGELIRILTSVTLNPLVSISQLEQAGEDVILRVKEKINYAIDMAKSDKNLVKKH